MKPKWKPGTALALLCMMLAILPASVASAAEPASSEPKAFPRSLESYNDADVNSIWAILKNRIEKEPFNLVATLIFARHIEIRFITVPNCFIF
ncbi:MAG: hypothetical protein P8185_17645 [Deltaproteobacteria bacterium]